MSVDNPTTLSALGLAYIAEYNSVIYSVASLLGVPAMGIASAIVEEASAVASSTFKQAVHATNESIILSTSERDLEDLYEKDSDSGAIGEPKYHNTIGQIYDEFKFFFDPLHFDVGIGNIQVGVAISAMYNYFASPEFSLDEDPLNLWQYNTDLQKFSSDLISSQSDLTVKIEGLEIEQAQDLLVSRYGSNYTNATDDVKAAELTVVNKIGPENIISPVNPSGLDPSAGSGGSFVLNNYGQILYSLTSGNPSVPAWFGPIPISFTPDQNPVDAQNGFSAASADGNTLVWTGGLSSAVMSASQANSNGDTIAVGSLASNVLRGGTGSNLLFAYGSGTNTFIEGPSSVSSKSLLIGGTGAEQTEKTTAQEADLAAETLPTDIFVGGASKGEVTSIGGLGSNIFELDVSHDTGQHIYWGGGGTSTYYINGSPTVYVYYMDNPTVSKVAALTPDMISAEYPSIKSTVDYYPGHEDLHLDVFGQPIIPSNGEAYIINPGPNDRIYSNGVLLNNLDDNSIGKYNFVTINTDTTDHEGLTAYTSINIGTLKDSIDSNYIWFYSHPSIGAPGPDTVQSAPGRLSPGPTIANFINGDFGITYSGQVADDYTRAYEFEPNEHFMNWNTQYKLSVQTSDENGSRLNSGNGSVMAGSGAVDYGIAADTPTSLISSQGGSQAAVVDFLGSTTLDTLSVAGGGGSDGLGLVLQDASTGQTVTVLDGLGATATRIASLAFSDGTTLSYSSILQTLATGSPTHTKLYGDRDTNVIDSQGYATYAQGNGGGDTFVYNPGYGALEVNEIDQDSSPNNVLQLGSGIAAAQLMVTADAVGNLYLADGTPGDRIQLDNQLNGRADGVQSVTFADGSILTAAQLVALETTGTAGADILYGSVGRDVFDGQGAPMWSEDYEQGNGGSDTFVYDAGYGQLEVNEVDKGTSPNNVLQFGPGISAAQLTVTADYSGNLYLTDGTSGDQIQLDGQLNSTASGVQTVAFSDGSSLTASQLIALETTGTAGADRLYGSSGADVIDGKGAPLNWSEDYAQGNGGGDTFVYDTGYGQLEISEQDSRVAPHNVLQFGPGTTAVQLIVTADLYGNMFIADGTQGDQIQLDSQLVDSFYGVQLVTFADGSTLTAGQLVALETTGTPGADTLIGTAAADMLDGKGAPTGSQDYEQGNGGGDTFIFNLGYGKLEISENEVGSNVVQFGAGIIASQLSVTVDQFGNLLIADGIAGDLVQIDANYYNGATGVQRVAFADGSTLTAAQLETLATTGTANADPSVYIFGKGSGPATINPNSTIATIQFGAGISARDVTFQADNAGDLTILVDGDPASSLTISSDLYYQSGVHSQVNQLSFADGTSMALDDNITSTWTGTATNTVLTGTFWGSNTYVLGAGRDQVTFAYGIPASSQNTVLFGRGDGGATIDPNGVSGTIQFGAGISVSDLTFQADDAGDFTILVDGDPASSLTINRDLYYSYDGYEGVHSQVQLSFADGTSMALGNGITSTWTGTVTNTVLTGSGWSANTFVLGAGGDQVTFGDGSLGGSTQNTVLFGRGDGGATIDPNRASGTVQFTEEFTTSSLWLSHSGNDLIVSAFGSADTLSIKDWFSETPQSWSVVTADGFAVDSQLGQLIEAMDTYAQNTPAFDPMKATAMPTDPQLQSALTAAWHS